jgi:epoxyqueuosine reductase
MARGSTISISNNYIKEKIEEKAEELGFFKIGFAKSEVEDSAIYNYSKWIESGYHSEMKWMERNNEKRANPSLILENCKSIIVLAYSYNNNIVYSTDKNKISRYAFGEDYHDVVLAKLKLIESTITEIAPEAQTKSYTDTGAILEKYWAERAGIGWQGKNSLIINKDYGSYFFIGIILTTLEFDESEKSKNLCGKCNKCITKCPTKAIVEDKVVNSEKCISYWTIESKEREFPENISSNLNNWAFGCDICQEVCPWNKKAIKINKSEFLPKNGTNLDELSINRMSDEEFRLAFNGTPIKRRKLKGIVKNLSYLNK